MAALVALGAPGCRQGSGDAKGEAARSAAASQELPPPAPPGQARRIEIHVDDKGYHPPSAPARAGEKLVLVFTRDVESECVHQVVVEGKTTDLPLKQPVEIPVTMAASGDLVFTCGMKMWEGRVAVVNK
jgi:plastocyanin domain-containing protein